jgi:WD40 repeat protein
LAAFSFTEDVYAKTIYEFDASTLETVGTPFEGHTSFVSGLALSLDGALLASSSWDDTIKLWAFESRHLLASFDVQNPNVLILSPDSCKLAYTTCTTVPPSNPDLDYPTFTDYRICICDTPPDILAQARVRNLANIHFPCANIPLQTIARKKRIQSDLLNVRVPFFCYSLHHSFHHHQYSLMQPVGLRLGTADRQSMPYL